MSPPMVLVLLQERHKTLREVDMYLTHKHILSFVSPSVLGCGHKSAGVSASTSGSGVSTRGRQHKHVFSFVSPSVLGEHRQSSGVSVSISGSGEAHDSERGSLHIWLHTHQHNMLK